MLSEQNIKQQNKTHPITHRKSKITLGPGRRELFTLNKQVHLHTDFALFGLNPASLLNHFSLERYLT